MQDSLVTLEKIILGGINQWIYIRAKDVKNPIFSKRLKSFLNIILSWEGMYER